MNPVTAQIRATKRDAEMCISLNVYFFKVLGIGKFLDTHRHIHTDTYTQTHTHRHIHTDTYTHTHIHRHIPTDTYTQTHTHTPYPLVALADPDISEALS